MCDNGPLRVKSVTNQSSWECGFVSLRGCRWSEARPGRCPSGEKHTNPQVVRVCSTDAKSPGTVFLLQRWGLLVGGQAFCFLFC